MAAVRTIVGIVIIIAIAALFAGYYAYPEIPAIKARPSSDNALIARGAELALLGNCATCHTAPGGKLYAGGGAVETPFGKIYASNITPDMEAGIGGWSEQAFLRAMQEGVDRAGRHLYPAFPYDHFTLMSDADDKALYGFLMSQEAVKQQPPPNELPFPLNIRLTIAGWKLLYFRPARYQASPSKGEQWNRGAYLAQGVAHCGACHTPRNVLGAERKSRQFDGALIEGWGAYAINRNAPAPVHWTEEALAFYLYNGWHREHGMARGPMVPVVQNLGAAPEGDAKAIASYVASQMGSEPANPIPQAAEAPPVKLTSAGVLAWTAIARGASEGERIFASACAICHEAGRPLPLGAVSLSLSSGLNGPTPQNAINVTLYGLAPHAGEKSAIMPPFRTLMNDSQLEALLNYMRTSVANKPEWPDLAAIIRKARNPATSPRAYPSPGLQRVPAQSNEEHTAW